MFPEEREMGKEDCEDLSFFKIFQGADLSSESMRAFPYDVPEKDFSRKMVITTQWGSSWEVEISMNQRFYYMEKLGWNQFVSDNALGDNELVTFTHEGLMCFTVNIFGKNGKEVMTPRKPQTMASLSAIKREEGECSNKDVKNNEELCESMGGVELNVRSNNKSKEPETSKKKKKLKSKKVDSTVPEFNITIKKSFIYQAKIPRPFAKKHIPNRSTKYTVHHSNGNDSWEVICLVSKTQNCFSSGWGKLARQCRLSVGDTCTFKLIKPTEFLLVVFDKAGKKKKLKSKKVDSTVPEFNITIKESFIYHANIPIPFAKKHIPNQSTKYTVHHSNGNDSWEVLCLVRQQTTFSSGWSALAREYPLSVGDTCTFKLIKPTEFLLVVSDKAGK